MEQRKIVSNDKDGKHSESVGLNPSQENSDTDYYNPDDTKDKGNSVRLISETDMIILSKAKSHKLFKCADNPINLLESPGPQG